MSDCKERPPQESMQAAYCCQTPMTKECLQQAIRKPDIKTSDVFAVCNLPPRFEHPHWFNGYGSQTNKAHPFYRTTSNDYGWFPPGIHSVPAVFCPRGQSFTNALAKTGMYRNYSLNTGMDTMPSKPSTCSDK